MLPSGFAKNSKEHDLSLLAEIANLDGSTWVSLFLKKT